MKGVELSQLGETSGRRILHAPEFIPEHSQEGFSQGLQQGLSNARQRFLSRRRADTGISSAQRLGTPSSTSSFRGYFVLLSYAHACYVPLQAQRRSGEQTPSCPILECRALGRTAVGRDTYMATHWNETAEFDVEGWHCISSAKKGAARAPKKKAAPGQRPETKAASQQDPQLDTSRADGVMVLLSKRIPANQVRWREIRKGRLLQVIFPWMGTRVHRAAVYQHAWSSKKTIQQNKEDRAKLLGEISSLIRSIPCRNTFLLAGDFNARLSPHEGLTVWTSCPHRGRLQTAPDMNPNCFTFQDQGWAPR